jgi:hypothetical protein
MDIDETSALSKAGRVDELGRAFAGSQRHIQTYVNLHPDELNAAIKTAVPELANARIEWVSPLESDRFVEYRDESFIGRIGYPEVVAHLGNFWPSGGPCWDGLAKIYWNDPTSKHGVLLVEAKSYPEEMWAVNGSRAGGAARRQIAATLLNCKQWCEADPEADWMGLYFRGRPPGKPLRAS